MLILMLFFAILYSDISFLKIIILKFRLLNISLYKYLEALEKLGGIIIINLS